MALQKIEFTTPTGRIVAGDVYKFQTKDADGKPLVIKSGPQAGQPAKKIYFGLAIPKIPGQHWSQYPRLAEKPDRPSWGEAIWTAAHQWMANASQAPKFAFKVTDGDSAIPNGKNNKPCDNEGWRGHWILHCSGTFAPKVYTADGSAIIPEVDAVRPGYYVQVAGSTVGNESSQNPGVYINPDMIALRGFGPIINTGGADPGAAGFGGGALPPGASTMPPSGMMPTPPAQGVPQPPPGHPAAMMPPQGMYPAPPVPGYTPPPPYPAILNPGAPPPGPYPGGYVAPPPPIQAMPPQQYAAPPVPGYVPPPPVPAGPQMTAAAGGASYAELIAKGWNDALLRQHGLMV